MLSKGNKDLLKAIARLKGNTDFEEVMTFISTSKTDCAQNSCIHLDNAAANKLAGGFIAFSDFERFVDTAEDELERIVSKEKR